MKTIMSLVCLLLAGGLSATTLPVSKVQLSGSVSANGTALEYATISAYGMDSTLVDGTITDADGLFSLQLPVATYRIRVDFIGLESYETTVDLRNKTELPPITLTAGNVNLEAVEVRAEKTDVSLKLNKKVFNVGNDALAQGGSANNVLEQLPSVEVSVDGQVSLRGNAGVTVLINGRPSALANNNALENINADQVESVEIITNPSARYEASGSGGIINIILKKGINRGYGGTLNVSTGVPNDHRLGLNLNLRREKFSAFANGRLRLSNYNGSGDLTRTSELAGNFSRLERNIEMDREDRNANGFAGFDYYLNEKTTLTFSYAIYHVINDDQSDMTFDLFGDDDNLTESWNQFTDYQEPGTYQQFDLSLNKKLKGEQEEITIYLQSDLTSEEELENIMLNTSFPDQAELLNYRTTTIEGNRDYLVQADYENRLGEYGKFELGLRGETRVISADYLAEIPNGDEWELLPGFENEFDYFESVGSVYGQYNYNKNKFGFQLGLRNEYTEIRVENSDEANRDFKKGYNRLFPSASMQYEMSESQSFQLSYSSRIRRPSFWQLNPFAGIENPTRLFRGNSDINPSFTDRLEMTYLLRTEKVTLNPSVYFSTTESYFSSFYDEEAENIFNLNSSTITEFPINLPREHNYGLEVNTTFRPSEALDIFTTLNVYGFEQTGQFADQDFQVSNTTWSGRLRASLDVGESTRLTVSGNYRAPVQMAQQRNLPLFIYDFGGSKRWGDRITISANLRSPRYFKSTIDTQGFTRSEYFQWTGWRGSLSFQYRFEKGADSGERRQRGSIR
ncbi:hypothetical protein CEQ90_01820 [Lewinellaceae bacterium SD302]|nr:hypothetical protein CEQ90_01820 [Lewinellaceae bacterium SD302]